MAGQLANCAKCNKLFIETIKPICNDCVKKVEEDFKKVNQFIRAKENKESTMMEVSEATGVSMEQIEQFIREKRLIVKHNPNLGYSCELCGTLITHGKMCLSCNDNLKKEIDSIYEREERMKSVNRKDYKGYMKDR